MEIQNQLFPYYIKLQKDTIKKRFLQSFIMLILHHPLSVFFRIEWHNKQYQNFFSVRNSIPQGILLYSILFRLEFYADFRVCKYTFLWAIINKIIVSYLCCLLVFILLDVIIIRRIIFCIGKRTSYIIIIIIIIIIISIIIILFLVN